GIGQGDRPRHHLLGGAAHLVVPGCRCEPGVQRKRLDPRRSLAETGRRIPCIEDAAVGADGAESDAPGLGRGGVRCHGEILGTPEPPRRPRCADRGRQHSARGHFVARGTQGTAEVSAAVPLHRNGEYLRWLVGDLLLDAGTGIGAFAFPLVTFVVTGELGITGLVALVQGLGALAGLIPGGLLADLVERRRLRLLAGATGAVIQGVLVLVLLTGVAGA